MLAPEKQTQIGLGIIGTELAVKKLRWTSRECVYRGSALATLEDERSAHDNSDAK